MELAPKALPLVGILFNIPPILLTAGAAASFAAAVGEVYIIPDDSTAAVALQVGCAMNLN